MTLSLPYPPSVNTYWRHVAQRAGRRTVVKVLVSAKGREYQEAVAMAARMPEPLRGRLGVTVLVYPPDGRARDLDNLGKALLDAMQHAGVYESDAQIDDLRFLRAGLVEGGRVDVEIREIGQ